MQVDEDSFIGHLMNNEEIKNRLVEVVTEKQGCKATELCAIKELIFGDCKPLPELIEELVKEERILEIEYVLPAMNYRIKSFLLPAGTQIKMTINISADVSESETEHQVL